MKKSLTLTLAILLVLGLAIGGTIAWLSDTTSEVVNTFTAGDVDIDLNETGMKDTDNDGKFENDYLMVPGCTIPKDPKVTVLANSEDCFVFVELTKSENFDTYMEYAMADGWTKLDGVAGVYYREVTKSATNQVIDVINGNVVTVKGTVTKAMMDALATDGNPTLTVKAYAIQKANGNDGFDAAGAWNAIKNP